MPQKKGKKWLNWVIAILVITPFLGVFIYGFMSSNQDTKELESYSEITIGKVVRTYRVKSRGEFIVYQFYVDGKLIEDHQPVSERIEKGTCYQVKYSPKSPENCKMALETPLECK